MTRTDRLAFDLESEGVGLWAEPGNVAGWRRALMRLLDDPQAARRMGERGRALCEERYNMEVFSARLARILKQTLKARRSPTSVEESPLHDS
jgi:glycosyltransferase involved in cell wall biosynthesis